MDDSKVVDSLVMVFTVFRHGDRAPIYFLPNDPNKDHWPEGPGSLTNEGKLQSFELGKRYRQRYDGFLSANYVPSEVYVYSTDVDRCLMSAQCCLAAMYPPSGQDKWLPTLDWQPIPIHTKAIVDDVHATTKEDVANFQVLQYDYIEERHRKWYQNLIDNKETWDKWRNFVFNNGQFEIFRIILACDTAYIEMKRGLQYELPPGTDLTSSTKLLMECAQMIFETHPTYVIKGSALLTTILTTMNDHINGINKPKMTMYSMHDANIWCAMGLLNIILERTTNCGSMTFELHKRPADHQYYVQLKYCARYDSEPVVMPLVENEMFCPLKTFEETVKAAQVTSDKLVNNRPLMQVWVPS